MFSFSLVTPPALEPVTLLEAKAHARIDSTADDALVTNLIIAARQWAERTTGRAFITQTWKLAIDMLPIEKYWPDDAHSINLPRSPLQSVTSVQYYDDNDAATLWATSNYFVDTSREPGRLVLRSGSVWPSPTRVANSMIVTYVAGYGSDASSVPEPIKTAIRELVGHLYEHRGDETAPPCFAAQALLNPYRVRFTGL
jgi:uncharacterized phiE125 gp8 family phage protein